MSKKTILVILISASILTHFIFFGQPNETVFDEVHFGKFVSGYYTHEYYFDIHPPLGKLMIAGFGRLFDFKPEFSFADIGQQFPDKTYLALRFLPSLAGTLLPVVIFLLALELGFSRRAAFLAGMLIILENTLLVQSRYILLDPFLLLFGFTGLLFYLKSRASNYGWKLLVLTSIFLGLAVSIKWTGLAFIGLTGIIEFVGFLGQIFKKDFTKAMYRAGVAVVFLLVIPLLIYFSVFALHFSLLTKSGPGDAFMEKNFQQKNIIGKFVELNEEMYRANKGLDAEHSYGSPWYTWPLMLRPIYYWVDSDNSTPAEQKIYLIGNPIIWWGSTIAVIYALLSVLNKKIFSHKTLLILLGGYIINLLPFIGISRVMFLYHYLAALIFAILMLAYLIDRTNKSRMATVALIIAGIACFIYFAPLSYGLSLSKEAFQHRIWLPSWL